MKQKTKQKVITEREIIRFRQCLYKTKAVSDNRAERQQSIRQLREEWEAAI